MHQTLPGDDVVHKSRWCILSPNWCLPHGLLCCYPTSLTVTVCVSHGETSLACVSPERKAQTAVVLPSKKVDEVFRLQHRRMPTCLVLLAAFPPAGTANAALQIAAKRATLGQQRQEEEMGLPCPSAAYPLDRFPKLDSSEKDGKMKIDLVEIPKTHWSVFTAVARCRGGIGFSTVGFAISCH